MTQYISSLKNHNIIPRHGFGQKITLLNSENKYLVYPRVGVLHVLEQGVDLSIISAVFHAQNNDGSLGAPAVVKNPVFTTNHPVS